MSGTGSYSSGGMPKNPTFNTLVVTTALQLNAGAVFDLYNTADKVTNYERLRAQFTSNVAEILTQQGGTGAVRNLRIGIATVGGVIARYFEVAASGTASSLMTAFQTAQGSTGTQTIFNIAPTISQSVTAGYTVVDINPQETGTGSGTKLLLRAAVGGTAVAQLYSTGQFYSAQIASTGVLGLSGSLGGSIDVALNRDAADTLALRRSTNAQTDRNYETYTDGSNYSRMYRSWLAGFAYFGTQAAGTGTRRPLIVQHFQTTVGALPAAATAGAGSRCHVSDALGPVFGAAVVGGGAVSVPVYSDGAAWLVG